MKNQSGLGKKKKKTAALTYSLPLIVVQPKNKKKKSFILINKRFIFFISFDEFGHRHRKTALLAVNSVVLTERMPETFNGHRRKGKLKKMFSFSLSLSLIVLILFIFNRPLSQIRDKKINAPNTGNGGKLGIKIEKQTGNFKIRTIGPRSVA